MTLWWCLFKYISIHGLYAFFDDRMGLQVNQTSFLKYMVLDCTPHLARPIIGTCLIDKIQVHVMVIVDQTQILWRCSVPMTIHGKWKVLSITIFSCSVCFHFQFILTIQLQHLQYAILRPPPPYLIYHHVRFARPTKIQDDDLLGTLFVWSRKWFCNLKWDRVSFHKSQT
jgi:hypothetical protein